MREPRPPMGWNSWDCFGTTVTESEVLSNARVMADALRVYGWDTVVVDIDWYDPAARAHGYNAHSPMVLDAFGRQMPDPVRFPSSADGSGFTAIARQVHDMGLRFGIHVMRGIPRLAVDRDLPVAGSDARASQIADRVRVCPWNPDNYGLDQSRLGAQAWYDAQVDLVASWGVDFLKVDDMQTPFHADEIAAYRSAMVKAERKYGRSLSLSLSPGAWLSTRHADFLRGHAEMWRISDDLWDDWDDVFAQFPRLARWSRFSGDGHWADADMLPLGHIGIRAERGEDRLCGLSADEQLTMLALWCMARSPLMVGGDLTSTPSETLDMLRNASLREVTAGSRGNAEILREPVAGVDGRSCGEVIVWLAQAVDWADGTHSAHPGGWYVAVFWTGDDSLSLGSRLHLSSLVPDARGGWRVTDLAEGVSASSRVHIGTDDGALVLTGTVAPHGVAWMVLEPAV